MSVWWMVGTGIAGWVVLSFPLAVIVGRLLAGVPQRPNYARVTTAARESTFGLDAGLSAPI